MNELEERLRAIQAEAEKIMRETTDQTIVYAARMVRFNIKVALGDYRVTR